MQGMPLGRGQEPLGTSVGSIALPKVQEGTG
jgi:hypothetical protein